MKSRFFLIVLGLALGWLARLILGAPSEETGPSRVIERPLTAPAEEEVIDIPLNRRATKQHDESGLIPPLRLPGKFPFNHPTLEPSLDAEPASITQFEHDPAALFEAHGEQMCASGCAASRHPTEPLTLDQYHRLIKEYAYEPMDQTNNALEALLYYGPQTRQWMESEGAGLLDQERAEFLWEQLQFAHASVSIRVTDEQGVIRTWANSTRVPFDRRHIFEMQTNNLQHLVTSGTIKRVGLNHSWIRL